MRSDDYCLPDATGKIACKYCRGQNENARLRAALEECAKALEHAIHRPHEHNPLPSFGTTHCEVFDRAIAKASEALK